MAGRNGIVITIVIVLAAVALCVCSCRKDPIPVYSSHVNFDSSGWDPLRALEFQPYPVDSLIDKNGYDVIIYLRYNRRSKLAELPVEIEEVALEGELADVPRESVRYIKLADEDKNPRGKYSHGIYEIVDTIARDFKIPDGYTLTLSHSLPQGNTSGLMSLGIVMSPAKP